MRILIFLGALGVLQIGRVSAQVPTQGVPRTPTGAETIRCTTPIGQVCSTSSQTPTITPRPGFFPTWPASIRPDQAQADSATFLLSSLQSSWSANITYTALAGAVYVAAPADAQYSLAVNGWNWDRIVRSEWYNGGTYNDSGTMVTYAGVTKSWKAVVVAQEELLQSGFNQIFGLSSGGNRVGIAGLRGFGVDGVVVEWVLISMAWIGVWGAL